MLKPKRKSPTSLQEHPTRVHLIEETARQIEASGITGVDVESVLANLGVTKGALYHHFGSINDLLVAGLLHAFRERMDEAKTGALALINECTSAAEARDRLYSRILMYHEVPARNPLRSLRMQAFTVALTEPSLAPEIARLQTELTEAMTDIAREMQNRGWARNDFDPHAFAALVQALNQGRVIDDIVDEADRVNSDAWVSLVKTIFDRNFFILD